MGLPRDDHRLGSRERSSLATDAWIPDWFPGSGLELLPNWLRWVPFPIDASLMPSLIPLVFANVLLAAPGLLLVAAGEKLRSKE